VFLFLLRWLHWLRFDCLKWVVRPGGLSCWAFRPMFVERVLTTAGVGVGWCALAVVEFLEAPSAMVNTIIKAFERGELPITDADLANQTKVDTMEMYGMCLCCVAAVHACLCVCVCVCVLCVRACVRV